MKIQVKSAQNIVKRYVQKLPPKIYKLLYLSCKQNQECSYYIFDNDDFLSGELRNYPEEVSGLLKEAISNLSQIKIEDRSGDVITEWVKLLDCLDSSKQKIEDQIFYAELVSKALVDPQDNGIMKYQNKCCVEIFSRGKIGKSKALITFGMNEQKPVIIFYKENTLIEYLEENKPLQSSQKGLLPVGKYNEQDSACFYIEEICKAAPEKPDLYPYINYVAAVVQLYANLCKGRNKKSLKKMQTLGISNDHILCILKSAYTTLNLKSSYYTLYQVLFLDIEPFLSLNNTFNRNWLPEFETDIEALIRLMHITQQRNQKEQQNSIRLKGEQLVEQDQFDVFKLDREKWRQKIKLFLNILNLTKQTIDLGVGTQQYHQKLFDTINKLLDLKKIFLKELNMLELIDGSQEIQLYRELEGNSVGEGQIVSPFRLETQVRKIIFDENNMKNLNIKSEKKSDERMLEINNQLNKICKKLKDLKNDSNTILKAQNIFRNTGTHQSIKLLLSLEQIHILELFYSLILETPEQNDDFPLQNHKLLLTIHQEQLNAKEYLFMKKQNQQYLNRIQSKIAHNFSYHISQKKKTLELCTRTQKFQHNNEEKYNETLAKRKQLTNFTKQYFLETKITDYMNDLGQYNNHGTEIIEDPQEYWEYLYSGKQWNQSKDGLLMFILDIYHEIKINQIMSFEYDTQRDALPQEDR
ncbi:hypothetical protein PPERSA_12659 [Pseudocohnilembus persalinus]|uniref:Uncharacterized protein n=1 Tax=Pseudocohnilembus persalinus TaxID=266149 RepID=A0A0V0QMC3_PSEPJ|nr:hypothetical protein PPERSA_12659 [Pseudocohnilembus persalinus]|eukprot:KRX03380.1 hypothetical protein PPERSA_12659 [Pseudocohnilembus persalinus]